MNSRSTHAVEQLKAILSHAQFAPTSIAVVDQQGTRHTTYSQFIECANFYAWYLKEMCNVCVGDVIALHLGRCMEHFALRIACAFAGFTFVSINPDFPSERTECTIERAGVKLVINDAFLDEMERARLSRAAEAETESIPCQLDTSLDDSTPYYIMSTSGTTGEPKLILHDRSVFELMDIITHDFGFDTYDVNYAAMADMMFIMSVVEMLFFSAGDTLHIISNDMRTNISALREYFERESINSTSTLPALLAAISPLPSLRSAFVAGEASAIDLTAYGTNVLNFYGASEVPGMAYGAASGSGALDHTFTNTNIWLEDESGARIPQNATGLSGEVCFCGPGVMCAYIGDSKATAAHVSQEPNSRYRTYHTGDAAYYNEAGGIVLSGRLDSMVKIRGQRVDVAGVEHVLAGIEGIAECAVVARETTDDMVLAAFYVTDKDQPQHTLSEETLRTILAKKLPSYAIPTYFILVESFARATNGKINRAVLELPDALNRQALYAAPENDIQRRIIEAFSAELGIDNIGIDDDFIRLGGDSLKAMRISAALGEEEPAVATADILRLRTPRAISEIQSNVIQGSVSHSAASAECNTKQPSVTFSNEDALPLTEPQLNVHLDMQAKNKTDAYLICEQMDLPVGYTIEQVQSALHTLCAAHPVLCRKLTEIDGTPYLVPGKMPQIVVSPRDDTNHGTQQTLDITQALAHFSAVQTQDCVRIYATFHHLIFDGTSWIIFQRDLLSALEGKVLPPDESFLRAATQAASLTQHPQFEEAQAFFDDMLAETDEVAPLLPDVQTSCAGRRVKPLSIDASQVNVYCMQTGITASVLFTAAFAYTLSRFTGDNKALINFLDNGRDACHAHDAIGMFVTTCPLFVDCSLDDPRTFVDLCARSLYQATTYSFYPYRTLAAEYNIDASILFQYRPDLTHLDIAQSNWEEDEDFTAQVNLESDLGFHVTQAGNSYQAEMTYSARYSSKTAKRILYAFESILTGIIKDEQLGTIAFTSPEDLTFQNAVNKTETAVAHDDVLTAFAQALEEYPNNVLISHEGEIWTYSHGARIASAIANTLEEIGVKPEDNVAVLVPRSQRYLLCALGVLAAGAAYVPLDDAYPDERLAFMLKDTAARAVLVTTDTAPRAQLLLASIGSDASLINADSLRGAALEAAPWSFSYRIPSPDDTACILYTSGTTGTPKGSLITRRAIANFCQWFADSSLLRDGDAYALYASYGFDVHLEMFAPLLVGAKTAIVPEEARLDMPALLEFYVRERISAAHLPVSVARLLRGNTLPDGLHVLRVGGEAVGDLSLDGTCQVLDTYGPTESTVTATYIPVESKVDPSSIGRPLPNVAAYVLDSKLRRVPVGAVGQLFLSGYQLAKGYLNRPKETAAAFIPNFFDGEKPGYERMYATGDMARILPDGTIGFIGRRDSQVKVRGNRVEPSEVETCIRQLDYVAGATVQVVDAGGAKELCAYVVAAKAGMGEDELHRLITAHVAACKPSYMVPTFVVGLDAIPLNVNGKVDRRALPKPDLSRMKASYRAPESKAERLVTRSFEEVLGLERVGLDDDFIRLGGDSIKAIRVVSLLRRKNLDCQAKDVLQLRTPLRIARILKTAQPDACYEHMQGTLDLLPIQSRFFEKAESNTSVQLYITRATERLDVATLERSLQILCDTHDMLRAMYHREPDGTISQVVRPQNTCSLAFNQIDDLAHADELLPALHAGIASLDIYEGRLGCAVLGHGSTFDYVAFAIHHLVVDGVSWQILLDDLADIYTTLKAGQKPDLPCPYPYGAWVNEVQFYATSMDEAQKRYWKQTHSLLKQTSASMRGESMYFDFSFSASSNPENIYGLSEGDYLLCAAARAYKLVYGTDALFDLESSGRDMTHADTSRTVGWFTTRYPVHLPLSAGNEVLDVARDVIALKQSLAHVPDLGIGYGAMAYISHEIDALDAPVTFNYLADTFAHSNRLFESAIDARQDYAQEDCGAQFDMAALLRIAATENRLCNGLTLNIFKRGNSYLVSGAVAAGTSLHKNLPAFLDELKAQASFVACALDQARHNGCALYPLMGNQMGFYLDEVAHDKSRAFLTSRVVALPEGLDEKDVRCIAGALIRKHPILSSHIELGDDGPVGVCDAHIKPQFALIVTDEDKQRLHEILSAPFDMSHSLARFIIVKRTETAGKPDSFFLAFCLHHIISDLYTGNLLEKEIYALASRARNGEELTKNENTRDWGFLHTAMEDLSYRASTNYTRAKTFFADYLADVPSLNSTPPQLGNGTAGRAGVCIPELSQSQRDLAHRLNITERSLFLAAFAYTLAVFSATEKVYFNFTEHGRHSNEELHAVGMYVRSFPVVIDCVNRPVSEFLTQAFASSMAAMQHSAYPLYELINDYGASNEVTFENNAVFDSLVPEPDEGIAWESLPKGVAGIANFECTLLRSEHGYVFAVTHTGAYSKECALSFAQTYRNVLASITTCKTLSDITSNNQQAAALTSINSRAAVVQHPDIIEAFDGQVARAPHAVCLKDERQVFDYAQADTLSDSIAQALSQHNISQQDFAIILTGRNALFSASMLACLKADVTYIPLDEDQPAPRIARMMQITNCKLIIATPVTHSHALEATALVEESRAAHNREKVTVLCLDDVFIAKALEHPKRFERVTPTPQSRNCILFTSGTTGEPKGIVNRRATQSNLAQALARIGTMTTNSVYGLYASFGYSPHLDSLAAFVSGASIDVIPAKVRLDMTSLCSYFDTHAITHTFLSSSIAYRLFEQANPRTLKVVFRGGEPVKDFANRTLCRIFDEFGCTECSNIFQIEACEKLSENELGYPIDNTHVYLLDIYGRPTPPGAAGRLFVSGEQLAACILESNSNEQEAKRAVSNAFVANTQENKAPFERMYPTGDIATLANERIVHLGRKDGVIKVRGNRVELGEVESCVRAHESIADACVRAIDVHGTRELVAYVVLPENHDVALDDARNLYAILRNHVAAAKPAFMVPSSFVVLDAIPLNAHGKVDTRALPIPDTALLHAPYAAPRNDIERAIVHAFEEVLKEEHLGIDDDFISLGGDSLKAIRVSALLSDYGISGADILRVRTPRACAACAYAECDEKRASENKNKMVEREGISQRESRKAPSLFVLEKMRALYDDYCKAASMRGYFKVPLSEPQLNVYIDCVAHGLDVSYLDAVQVSMPEGMSEDDTVAALKDLRRVHPILAARIITENETPLLSCDATLTWCGEGSEDEIQTKLMAPFDFSQGLVRFGIVRRNEQRTLICVVHHLITDFSSDSLLALKVNQALTKTMLAAHDSEPDLGFVLDAAYCQATHDSELAKASSEFYAELLDGCDGSTHLMADAQLQGEAGHEFYLDTGVTVQTLSAFARKKATTTGAVLAAAFAYTLSEFTDEARPVFSALDAGRARLGLKESLGCFLRTDTLRITCNIDTVDEFLEHASAVFTGALEYNTCPYQQLAAAYNLDNSICFNYAPASTLKLNRGLAGMGASSNVCTILQGKLLETHATNDLDFGIYEHEGHIVIRPKYSAKFSDTFMRSFARMFCTVLKGLMDVQHLAKIIISSEEDIEAQNALNATEHTPVYPSLLDAFLESLARYPENTLVTHLNSTTTYAQGARLAQLIARALQKAGVKPADKVAVFAPRSQWYLLGALGVIAAGAAYVPIDEAHPDERIAFMLADAAVSAVLVTPKTAARSRELLGQTNSHLPLIDMEECTSLELNAKESDDFLPAEENLSLLSAPLPSHEMHGEDTACILYTSGTTGKPKGTRITQQAIANFCEWFVDASQLRPQDTYALYVSYGFDVHLEMFAPLLVGAATAVVPESVRLDAHALLDFFARERITTTELPVSVARLLKGHVLPNTLRVLHTGGEAVGDLAFDGTCVVLDTYGPTEYTVNATWIPVAEKTDASSIGRPLPNTKAYVLDAHGRRVPCGAVGELHVSGVQIAAGYLNRPDETRAAFKSNPFDENIDGYERMYATGDMARFLADGTIGFLGRRDSQVKIRGNRVELGEVEACLAAHPNVGRAVVRALDVAGSKELVAYIVFKNSTITDGGTDGSADEEANGSTDTLCQTLLAHVTAAKPAYMVPAYVIPLDAIPLTANGKVDVRALPTPDISSLRATYKAPAGECECAIAHAFEVVLELETIGAYDDFVRLGGDSLKAIRAASLLDEQGISASDILRLKTPHAIAANCKPLDKGYTQEDIANTVARYIEQDLCPLAASQLNVYYDQLAGSKNTAYRLVFSIDVTGDYSLDCITRALEHTCEAHPILSKRIAKIDGRAFLAAGPPPIIEVIDELSSFDAAAHIDMYTGPLARFSVLPSCGATSAEHKGAMDKADYVSEPHSAHPLQSAAPSTILCVVHHCIFDAQSLDVFIRDFEEALRGEALVKDLHFLEAAAIDELNAKTGRVEQALEFFDDMFTDVEHAKISPLQAQSRGYVAHRIALDPHQVEAFTKQHALTETTFFIAAFAYAYSVFAGSETASFCVTDNGRSGAAYDEAVGMYVKNIPLVVDCSIDTVIPYLEHVYNRFYAAKDATILPIGEIARKHPVAYEVLFQYFSDMQNKLFKHDDADELTLPEENWEDSIADLDFYLGKDTDDFVLYVRRSARYDEPLVQSLVATFEHIANQLMSCVYLKDMMLCAPEDIKRMDETNVTDTSLRFTTISDAVQDHAIRTPHAPAIVSGDVCLDYKELDESIDAFAKTLAKKGVCAGSRVALSCVPCATFAVAALAIMRLGASYVPVDMQQPSQWVQDIIRRAQAKAVVDLSIPARSTTPSTLDDSDEMNKPSTPSVSTAPDVLGSSSVSTAPGALDEPDIFHPDFNITVLQSADTSAPENTNEACVIFTSGSTGNPKGVRISQRGIANVSQWFARYLGLEPGSICGMYQNLSFVSHLEPLFAPLYVGATTDIIPANVRMDMEKLTHYLSSHNVDTIKVGSSLGRRFVRSAADAGIKRMLLAGERLGELEMDSSIDVIDAYGSTENTARALAIHLSQKQYSESIGYPIDNTKVYVIDAHGRRLPPCATGMLCTSGFETMLGYIDGPESTTSVFSPNTFEYEASRGTTHENTYSTLLFTGDRARILPDGSIGFQGRVDDQVQIRGMRVEPFEVEACVRTCNGVADATVQPKKVRDSIELVAYVVPTPDYKQTHEDVNQLCTDVTNHVATHKPSYLVPAFVIVLDTIPRTDRNKLDKRALPSPQDIHSQGTYVAPATQEEVLLCETIQKVLNIERLGVEDSLRRMGFSSLHAIETAALIHDDRLEVQMLLTHDTVRSIATCMVRGTPLEQDNLTRRIPITDEQKKYFYAHGDTLIDCECSYSNLYRVMRVDDTVEPEHVESVCRALISAHPYVQATFEVSNEGVFLIKQTGLPLNFHIVYQDEFNLAALHQPYNYLDGSPLYRIYFIVDARGGKTVCFDVSHALFDAFSFQIFEEDLAVLMQGKTIVPEESTAYDYALEVQRLKREQAHAMHDYYQALFANYIYERRSWLDDARDRSRTERIVRIDEENTESFAEAARRYQLIKQSYDREAFFLNTFTNRIIGSVWSHASSADVEQYCAATGVTMNCFLYGIFARAFAQSIDADHALLLVVYNGRMMARYERTVGCLASTVPLYVSKETLALSGSNYFKQVQSLLNAGYAYSYFSHEDILRANGISAPAVSVHYYDQLHDASDNSELDLKATLTETMDCACMKVYRAEHLFVNLNMGHDLSEGLTREILERFVALIDESIKQGTQA